MSYVYDILSIDPMNTNSFNLLTRVKIIPDIKLLELFDKAPLHNILCKLSGTNSKYDEKVVYGKIDKSLFDQSYYVTMDHTWSGYPDKNGKIEFLEKSVEKTIEYLKDEGGPIITEIPNLNLLYNGKEHPKKVTEKSLQNKYYEPKMNLYDVIIPISISLIVIGYLTRL